MPISLNFYLDTRNKSKIDSECEKPIKLSITKNSQTSYLPTGLKVRPTQWKNNRITGRPDKARMNDYLDSFKARARDLIYSGRDTGAYIDMTATEIKNSLAQKMGFGHVETTKNLFLDIFIKFAESRSSVRTKEIYRVTARKIKQIVPRIEKVEIDKIDLAWLEDFDDLLIARGNNPSTRSLDFRNIRAVLKYAQKHRLIQENPFEDFKIPAGESPNRALTIDQLRTLKNAQVEAWERKYLDFFFLSFYLIGMNTEDLLHAYKIENGRIDYIRSKTKKPMSVRVEPEAMSIIRTYRGNKHLLNILDSYANTHNWTSKVDATLKNIAARNGLPPVTMYWARHTWATLAYCDLGIDLDTISDALGHQHEKRVTQLYIKKKDYSKVDEANKKVIEIL